MSGMSGPNLQRRRVDHFLSTSDHHDGGILRICDILGENNEKKTLKSCSLVSSMLNAHCRKHLLRRARISVGEHLRGGFGSNIPRLLEENPSLGSYIKRLSLDLNPSDEQETEFNTLLPSTLQKCTHVTDLQVSCFGFSLARNIEPDWSLDLPIGTQRALESIIHSTALTRLSILDLKVPVATLFCPCQGKLTFLHISNTFGSSSSSHYSPSPPGPISSLETLHAHPLMLHGLLLACMSTIGGYQRAFDFTDLHNLKVHVRSPVDTSTLKIALLFFPRLRRLSLYLFGKCPNHLQTHSDDT